MTVLDRIKKIGERWFLTEPLLFAVFCSHEFRENDLLAVPMRTGNRNVEFAPEILERVSDAVLSEFLKVEMFRILLKHPYQRQPPFAQMHSFRVSGRSPAAKSGQRAAPFRQEADRAEQFARQLLLMVIFFVTYSIIP